LGGNLFVSATLEVIEAIRLQNAKPLVEHLCKRHQAIIEEFAHKFKALQGLLLRHQQNLEYEAFPPEQFSGGGPPAQVSNSNPARAGRVRSPGRSDDADDEAYFESLDDDERHDAMLANCSLLYQLNMASCDDDEHVAEEIAPVADVDVDGNGVTEKTLDIQSPGDAHVQGVTVPGEAEVSSTGLVCSDASSTLDEQPAHGHDPADPNASLQSLLVAYDDSDDDDAAGHAATRSRKTPPVIEAATEAAQASSVDSMQDHGVPCKVQQLPDMVAEGVANEDKALGCTDSASPGSVDAVSSEIAVGTAEPQEASDAGNERVPCHAPKRLKTSASG